MAHELGHVLLLGHRRISDRTEDHEPLTDLLTVFFGMGVFTANSVIRENYWSEGAFAGWSMGRQGYLAMPMYGYAFALFARARGESNPAWSRMLRPDVRTAFRGGLRYLSQRTASAIEQANEPTTEISTKREYEASGVKENATVVTDEEAADQLESVEPSSQEIHCRFCGAEITNRIEQLSHLEYPSAWVCVRCRDSIVDNADDLQQEAQANADFHRFAVKFDRLCLLILLAAFLIWGIASLFQ